MYYVLMLLLSFSSFAYDHSGRLLLTQGVSQIEGSAGGGLTPWATIAGYGTRDEIGANFHSTEVRVQEYAVRAEGIAIGLFNRLELSYSKEVFNTLSAGEDLNLGHSFKFEQRTLGLKVRVFGDLVLDQDTWMPQVAIGLQHKENMEEDTVEAFGAEEAQDTDYYVSFTKLFLSQRILYNLTIRRTRANQLGFLGYGGDKEDAYSYLGEFSLAYLINRQLVIGYEYRQKPDNLDVAKEEDWYDLFLAWTPTKNISLTAAYVNLGEVALKENQSGIYTSLQLGF